MPQQVYHRVGEKLRQLRRERELTQAETAKAINVSPQQYQKYEDAQSRCSLTNLMLLAEFFDVSLGELVPMDYNSSAEPEPQDETVTEADLLARLVSSFVKLDDVAERLRLVQLVEAIATAQERSKE
jgi:transcriptional regulator with XRE-family HTH domain